MDWHHRWTGPLRGNIVRLAVFVAILACLVAVIMIVRRHRREVALYHAASYGDETLVQQLLEAGATGDYRDDAGLSPLHQAALGGAAAVVKRLLAAGVQVNERAKLGYTALHCAAGKGHLEVAEILVDAGADVEARTSSPGQVYDGGPSVLDGLTPLHCAAARSPSGVWVRPGRRNPEGRYTEIIALLVKSGAEVDGRSANGITPLFLAVLNGQKDVVQAFLETGANPNVVGMSGTKLIEAAKHYFPREVIEELFGKDSADSM